MKKTPLSQLYLWLDRPDLDETIRQELLALKNAYEENPDDQNTIKEIDDRFFMDLEFGTGGMRGIIGAGCNRMNIYTVRRITQGLADHINNTYNSMIESGESKKPDAHLNGKGPSAAISYDNRINSELFAIETACVLVANGIDVYIYGELMPTPALSFAVRYHGCSAGVMITASHNSKEYSGYKVYDSEGEQCLLDESAAIASLIDWVDIFYDVESVPAPTSGSFTERIAALAESIQGTNFGTVNIISETATDAYINAVLDLSMGKQDFSDISIVYSPLNGAGNKPVRRVLSTIGLKNVHIVKEQELPDGNFPTCPYPNPEKREALKLGLELCARLGEEGRAPDLLLATDPDCDRVGVAVLKDGEYLQLTGNETGVLLLDFILRSRTAAGAMPDKPLLVKTIVSTPLASVLARDFGVSTINVLTGFKFIGEQITKLEKNGEAQRYVFGFEESCGYMSGVHVRDKDAVNAVMLLADVAAECKRAGKTIIDRLEEIYEKYGYYQTSLLEFTMPGASGMEKIAEIMKMFRREGSSLFRNPVVETVDYKHSVRLSTDGTTSGVDLPKSDVLEYIFEYGGSVILRPSGTEPKLKVYLFVKGTTRDEAASKTKALKNEINEIINKVE